MQLVFVHLSYQSMTPYGACTHHLNTWVDASWNLRKGNIVILKDDKEKRRWTVSEVYKEKMVIADLEKKWGLALPKSQRTER